MANDFFNASGTPAQGGSLVSPSVRSEFSAIAAGFDKLPTLTGNAYKIVYINAAGSAIDVIGGNGLLKLSTTGIPSIAAAGVDYVAFNGALGTPTSGSLANCTGLPVAGGGTGRATSTTAYGLLAAGTTATGAHQTLSAGATTDILVGGGASALPVWTAATGSGSPVRATSPTLVTPVLGTPSSGNLSNCTADGTSSVGFRGIPQNSQSSSYTTVLADAGKHLLHPSADTSARTYTIDSNANVPYPIGTAITFVNQAGAGVLTIGITSDTMRLVGTASTGTRTLAANGMATALKLTNTEWIISGVGLT